ncbi:MAG: hemin receptor [Gemmatimonadaceae bacterium]|nr:hemin receptor [Gemmatimonadaceae bacterium]
MSPDSILLVQRSWGTIVARTDSAARMFYARLFELDPRTPAMFANADMEEQERKLMQMLALAINSLSILAELSPAIESLGRRHVAYGVTDEQYETVRQALLYMLSQLLGASFDDPMRRAWNEI